MAASTLDLWPEDLSLDTLSPLAILKTQAAFLEQRTGGLLQGDVHRAEAGGRVSYLFNVVAPGVEGGYSERILVVTHQPGRFYPVTARANCFYPEWFDGSSDDPDEVDRKTGLRIDEKEAWTDKEFIPLVRQVLTSAPVRALISSLLASLNEQKEEPVAAG